MSSTVAKPKERQFQVVPVPAVFTRGRWECIDYKDTGGMPWPCPVAIDNNKNEQQQITMVLIYEMINNKHKLGPGTWRGFFLDPQSPVSVERLSTLDLVQEIRFLYLLRRHHRAVHRPRPPAALDDHCRPTGYFDVYTCPSAEYKVDNATKSHHTIIYKPCLSMSRERGERLLLHTVHLFVCVFIYLCCLTMSSTVAKPKERQFQVVPVPAVFTRGRWECIDYKDTGGMPWPCPVAIDNNKNEQQQITMVSVPPPASSSSSSTWYGHGMFSNDDDGNLCRSDAGDGIKWRRGGGGTGAAASAAALLLEGIGLPPSSASAAAAAVSAGSTPVTETTPPLPTAAMTTVQHQQQQQQSPPAQMPSNASVPHFDISPAQSVPTTLGTEFVSSTIASAADGNTTINTTITSSTSSAVPNPVAIDNKIEQAMVSGLIFFNN
uniref:Uncharacterized protein n=1 Tax=Globodera pallida TaxID=36090 RepID=A0A183BW17_GLOPA